MNLPDTSIVYLQNLINEKSEVLITTHYNPDGDAIGSSLALYHFLDLLGVKAKLLLPNELPSFLLWMPGVNRTTLYTDDPVYGDELVSNADLIFSMDYNSMSRVKLFSEKLKESGATKVLIDHHIQPENEFDLSFSDTSVSSTSELLFIIVESMGFKNKISREMAECLFVGIMTDTGSFSFACNRPATFETAACLISTGIDAERIHRMVYDTYSESRMRLLGHCLSTNLKVLSKFATAYIWLSKSELDEFDYQQGDTEGVVNYALSIQSVAVAALFTERDDRIRVSLRSKGNFSVNNFARTHFNGGGHRNAAGGDIFMTMADALSYFESLLPQYSNDIKLSLENYR